jgi:hypothetical protein
VIDLDQGQPFLPILVNSVTAREGQKELSMLVRRRFPRQELSFLESFLRNHEAKGSRKHVVLVSGGRMPLDSVAGNFPRLARDYRSGGMSWTSTRAEVRLSVVDGFKSEPQLREELRRVLLRPAALGRRNA